MGFQYGFLRGVEFYRRRKRAESLSGF